MTAPGSGFFSFLIHRGVLEADDVVEVTVAQRRDQARLDRVAEALGHPSSRALAELVDAEGPDSDMLGVLAAELGLVTAVDAARLVAAQVATRPPVEAVLVRDGRLTAAEAVALREEFETLQRTPAEPARGV